MAHLPPLPPLLWNNLEIKLPLTNSATGLPVAMNTFFRFFFRRLCVSPREDGGELEFSVKVHRPAKE